MLSVSIIASDFRYQRIPLGGLVRTTLDFRFSKKNSCIFISKSWKVTEQEVYTM